MSTFTEHYNLIKPQEEDYYDVQDFNENMDTIDAQMMQTETEIAGVNEKIGTPTVAGDTLFSLLSKETGIIKSVQRLKYSITLNVASKTLAINPVNANKSFVIMERLYSTVDSLIKIDYTLSNDSFTVEHQKYTGSMPNVTFGFWIIEFY